MVVASKPDVFGYLADDRTVSVLNEAVSPTAAFVADNTIQYDTMAMRARISRATKRVESIDAEDLAQRLLGDTIFANMFLTGYAYQLGEIPIGEEAILRAIELNGAAVKQNQRAFRLGRLAAHDRAQVMRMAGLENAEPEVAKTLQDLVALRAGFLEGYQNRSYADHYRARIERLAAAERVQAPGEQGLAAAAARSLFKLMAYKDEYEVARLYTNGEFKKKLSEAFEGDFSLEFHLAPPIFGNQSTENGRPRKMVFGPWMMVLFRLIAGFKFVRGTPLDIFGYARERRLERKLISDYETLLDEIEKNLTRANYATAVALAEIPMEIKGYGYIKDRNCEKAKARERELLASFRSPAPEDHFEAVKLTVAAE